MHRFSLLMLVGSLAAAPAAAATYSATLASPVNKRIITRDVSWACGPAACQGATEQSRALVLCQGLAKRAGTIRSFVVNGQALGQSELDRCNLSAAAR